MKTALLLASALALQTLSSAQPKPAAHPIPTIVEKDHHFALMVDGHPFLMLGFQVNNSSAWPAYFDKIFPAASMLHANTIEAPVYWEQVEAVPGHYDFSIVDGMLAQARAHRVHMVLLWFGTWKNGSSHYNPQWMKQDQQKYPFLLNQDGRTVDSPSTFSPARLAADKAAFAALMRHLRLVDPQRTVLMVQVENEAGVWGGIRDYRPEADKEFAGQVPDKLVKALGLQPGTWSQVFGDAADETFQAWCIASYIQQVAAAGKAEYPLPLYVNAALRDPFHAPRGSYESGAPTDQNIQLYKIAAPALSVIAPDIYMPEYAKYMKSIELYKRFNNPLLIPETGNSLVYAHYVFAAIGQGAIGFAPFGLDLTAYSNLTTGAAAFGDRTRTNPAEERLQPFANEYALLAPIAGKLAQGNLDGDVRGASEDPATHTQTLDFPRWTVDLSYGLPAFGNWIKPKGNTPPDGGAVILALGPDEFLVAGHHVRVDFTPKFAQDSASPDASNPAAYGPKKRLFLVVEEGNYDAAGKWKTERIWNGDQTDYGLNFPAEGTTLLRVKLSTY